MSVYAFLLLLVLSGGTPHCAILANRSTDRNLFIANINLGLASTIFSTGMNDVGQLGVGSSTTPIKSYTAVDFSGAMQNQVISLLSTNFGNTTAALSLENKLYYWGSLEPAFPAVESAVEIPLNITSGNSTAILKDKIMSVVVGGSDAENGWITILTDSYKMYSIGNNDFGQFGNNKTSMTTVWISPIGLENTQIVQVAAGAGHTLVLDSQGHVYAFGLNNHGQLGINSTIDSYVPQQVPINAQIISIYAGGYHSVAVSSNFDVYVWGANNKGQLGTGTTTDYHTPHLLPGFGSVPTIYTGLYNTFVYATELYGTGDNVFNQLGRTTFSDFDNNFDKVQLTRCLSADNTLCFVGDCGNGQCGLGNTAPAVVSSPADVSTGAIAGKQIFDVDCGNQFSIISTTPNPWIRPRYRAIASLSTVLTIEGKYFGTGPGVQVTLEPSSLVCTPSLILDDRIECTLSGTLPSTGTISAVITRDSRESYKVAVGHILEGPPTIVSRTPVVYANEPFFEILGTNFPRESVDVTVKLNQGATCQSIEIINSTMLRCYFGSPPDRGILEGSITTPAGKTATVEVAIVIEANSVPPMTPVTPFAPEPAAPSAACTLSVASIGLITLVSLLAFVFI